LFFFFCLIVSSLHFFSHSFFLCLLTVSFSFFFHNNKMKKIYQSQVLNLRPSTKHDSWQSLQHTTLGDYIELQIILFSYFYFLLYFLFLFPFLYSLFFNIFPLFEMRCKFVLAIITSCFGYKYLVRSIIATCSDSCSDLFFYETVGAARAAPTFLFSYI
jgi:hypothetical protein